MGTKIIETDLNFKQLKPVGVVREVGGAGRMTISSEARMCMGINEGDLIEQTLYREENGEFVLVVRKYKNGK